MNPKKLIVPVVCILIGCAGGAAMGTVTAQAWPEPANVQRWQQECVSFGRRASADRFAEAANVELRQRGVAGWEFVGSAFEGNVICFKRPAP